MSDITLVVSAPGPTVELTADAPGAVTVTVNEGGGVSTHAELSDLATSGHPASVIAFTPTGSIAATTVQAAVAEVATDAAAAYQPLDSDLTAVAALTTPATTISGAVQQSSNLSDLASASSARTNLGLGGAAVLSVGTTAGTVAAGDDSRLSNARTPTAHASSHAGAGSDPITDLGPVTVLTTGAAVVPLVAKGAASQTANLQEWRTSAGALTSSVSSTGMTIRSETFDALTTDSWLNIGGRSSGTGGGNVYNASGYYGAAAHTFNSFDGGAAQLTGVKMIGYRAASVGLTVKGAASQTAKMQEWQNSAGAVLASVDAAGVHQWAAGNEQTTVGAAGAASALPATPTKWLKVKGSDGTTYVVPAFLAA